MSGPLSGIRVIELAGIGPGPFCGQMLADMGAEVISVERPGGNPQAEVGRKVLFRNRQHIIVDLKTAKGIETILQLCESADAVFEANRPGVAERLGLGPDTVLDRNPKIVYGRMTGWGQTGPLANAAGHDINYIALSGALHAIGKRDGDPVLPLNMVGDFGGGGLMLAFGMVCAILKAKQTGVGDVIDASMIEGSGALMGMHYALREQGLFSDQRGSNLTDGGAHFYDIYETADNKYITIGSFEPKFYALLREKLHLTAPEFDDQMNQETWPELKEKVAAVVKSKTRNEWDELLEGSDVCYAPVLDIADAPNHPHNKARNSFIEIDGVTHPAPTPRFTANTSPTPVPAQRPGSHTRDVLESFDFDAAAIDALIDDGIVSES